MEARIASHVASYLMHGLRALRRTRIRCILTLNRLALKCHRNVNVIPAEIKILYRRIFRLRVFGMACFFNFLGVDVKDTDNNINVLLTSAKRFKPE